MTRRRWTSPGAFRGTLRSCRRRDGTVAEREYQNYAMSADSADTGGDPDVLLDVPVVKVDSIHFQLENLDAHVARAHLQRTRRLEARDAAR
jgi:hypothetical protein